MLLRPLRALTERLAYPSDSRGAGADGLRELRPRLLVLSDLSGDHARKPLQDRKTFDLSRTGLQGALERIAPHLELALEPAAAPVRLDFARIEQFDPTEQQAQAYPDPARFAAIVQHARARNLARSWRTLGWLLEHGAPEVQVELLDCNFGEIAADFAEAPSLEKSALFRLVHDATFAGAGGVPYAAVLADFCIDDREPETLFALRCCAEVGAIAHAPVITTTLELPGSVLRGARIRYDNPDKFYVWRPWLAAWLEFAPSEAARYLVLVAQQFPHRCALPSKLAGTDVRAGTRLQYLMAHGGAVVAAFLMQSLAIDGTGSHIHSRSLRRRELFHLNPDRRPEADLDADLHLGLCPIQWRFTDPDEPAPFFVPAPHSCHFGPPAEADVSNELEHTLFAARMLHHLKWLYLEASWRSGGESTGPGHERASRWLRSLVAEPTSPDRPLAGARLAVLAGTDRFDYGHLELTVPQVAGPPVRIVAQSRLERYRGVASPAVLRAADRTAAPAMALTSGARAASEPAPTALDEDHTVRRCAVLVRKVERDLPADEYEGRVTVIYDGWTICCAVLLLSGTWYRIRVDEWRSVSVQFDALGPFEQCDASCPVGLRSVGGAAYDLVGEIVEVADETVTVRAPMLIMVDLGIPPAAADPSGPLRPGGRIALRGVMKLDLDP